MDWQELINKRHTTFAWDDSKVPSRSVMEEVLEEAYLHVPTKNLMYPYEAIAYRNDDEEIRKEIMTICHRNKDMPVETDRGNPQVLAPWLIGFTGRYTQDLEKRYERSSYRERPIQRDSEQMEIGMCAMFFAYAFASRGIQTGYCQNILNNPLRGGEIFGLEPGRKLRFIMGVGYGKDSATRHDYFDPRVGKTKKIPFTPDHVSVTYPRPDMEKVFRVL